MSESMLSQEMAAQAQQEQIWPIDKLVFYVRKVKAFRLLVNRSATWAAWDDELLALELQELSEADFDLSLTGFDQKEIDDFLLVADDDHANTVPPVPDNPVSRPGDLESAAMGVVNISYCVPMQPARKRWHVYWGNANQSSW
jgi:hypothetical protein